MKKQANTGVCFQIFCFLRVFIPVKTERLSSGSFPRAVTSAVPPAPPPSPGLLLLQQGSQPSVMLVVFIARLPCRCALHGPVSLQHRVPSPRPGPHWKWSPRGGCSIPRPTDLPQAFSLDTACLELQDVVTMCPL